MYSLKILSSSINSLNFLERIRCIHLCVCKRDFNPTKRLHASSVSCTCSLLFKALFMHLVGQDGVVCAPTTRLCSVGVAVTCPALKLDTSFAKHRGRPVRGQGKHKGES